MEDREIIEALERCGNIVDSTCKECVYHETYNASCVVRLMRDALNLINRKDTEIDILIRKKHALRDEVEEKEAEIFKLKAEISKLI